MIDCSSRLESDLLSQNKQVEDVERIAAEEGKDVCACIQFLCVALIIHSVLIKEGVLTSEVVFNCTLLYVVS